jgi:putative dehydrogenase
MRSFNSLGLILSLSKDEACRANVEEVGGFSMAGKIGFIGLGAMGGGMAKVLLQAGFPVSGYDVSSEAAQRFAKAGGAVAASPAAAAGDATLLILVVATAAQVEDALFGADGAAPALAAGATVALHATVPPDFARDLGQRLESQGVHLLDAPISGGAARAASGELTVMASGSLAAFAGAQAALDAMAQQVYRLGEAPGAGSTVKMINQLLAGVHIAVAAEAMALGVKAGADPRALYQVISNAAGNSWMFSNRVPHMLDDDYTPRSAVEIFVKDLGIVLGAGRELRFPLPLAAAAHQQFLAAAAAGFGRADDAAVVKVYEQLTGITVAAPPAD